LLGGGKEFFDSSIFAGSLALDRSLSQLIRIFPKLFAVMADNEQSWDNCNAD
jgi:hypothetical protein